MRLLVISMCLVVYIGLPISGRTQNARSIADEIQTAPVTQIRKGVDAWPLIADPSGPADELVNTTLARLNKRLAKALRDCDNDYIAWAKQTGGNAKQVGDDWSRSVTITMRGPRFLSLVASEEAFCGGAHPDTDQVAMVFDLNTGKPVNWLAQISSSADASSSVDSVLDGSTVGAVVLPPLRAMSLAAAKEDCKNAFNDPQAYELWPDARRERLVAQPFDMAHAVLACAEEIDLTMEQARDLGFDRSLLRAIEEAHRRQAEPR